MRQAEGPLSNRHVGEDMIDEMRRPLGHPPSAAPWAEAATFAREGHETILSAGGAPKTREAAGQTSTPQEIAELLLDKPREPLAVSQRRGVRTERLEMVTHDPVQDRRCGIARVVCARGLRHAQSTGAPRANPPARSIRRGFGDRVSEVATADYCGCDGFLIESSAGDITATFSACMLDPRGRRTGNYRYRPHTMALPRAERYRVGGSSSLASLSSIVKRSVSG